MEERRKGCLVAAETPPPLLGLLPPLSSPQDSDSLLLLHQFLVPRYHLLSLRFSDPHSISHHLVLLAIISWSKPPMTLPTYPVMILFDLSRGSNLTLGAVLFGFMAFEIQWVHEDRITLFTADGLVQIGGSITPRHVSSSDLVWEGLGLGGGTYVRNWGSLVYQAISIANNACWAIGELAVKLGLGFGVWTGISKGGKEKAEKAKP
ncbi:uncharacterized protein DS421_18g620420 [Arachis hypogaea]|nr:uncharacterized protein DS421_18g620420 [Arachis hypogaea]